MQKMAEDEFNEVFKYLKKNSIEEIKKDKTRVSEKTNNDDRNVVEEDQNEPFGEQWVNEFITIQKWNHKKD